MKMELISALIHEPKVLFLDEPTIGLDVVSQKRVRQFLRIYNSEHRIVTLLTSHYMQDIAELCDRVMIIDHGKIFFDGPLDTIIDRFSGDKVISLTFTSESKRDSFAFWGTSNAPTGDARRDLAPDISDPLGGKPSSPFEANELECVREAF